MALLSAVVLMTYVCNLQAQSPQPPVKVPASTEIDPADLTLKQSIDKRYASLLQRFEKWNADAGLYNTRYGDRTFAADSQEGKAGAAEQARLVQALGDYERDAALFQTDAGKLRLKKTDELKLELDLSGSIPGMIAMAKNPQWKWSADKQARLAKALSQLARDGNLKANDHQIRQAWFDVRARGQDAEMAREAARGEGPGLPGAGTQSSNDCTIFALAYAAGLPYSVVGTRATQLIRDAQWRGAANRTRPQAAIEQWGLSGYEVVMLTEIFGQAEIVPSSEFPKHLKGGRPLMVAVSMGLDEEREDILHQVVLTKTFQHGGNTWYEMLDSNQGPMQRRYLSATELNTMLYENGIAFRPEPGTTPQLLRKKE